MSGQQNVGSWEPRAMYDITPTEKKAMQERAAKRAELKIEWQKKYSSPHRGMGGYIFDPAVQRFMSMRANHWEQFKATPRTAAFGFVFGALPFLAMWYLVDNDIKTREARFRTGTVPYKDRDWKFIN